MKNNTNTRFDTFKTSNRKMEQFLYMHKIMFTEQYKDEDGLTTWVYKDTPELQSIVSEYRSIYGKRSAS